MQADESDRPHLVEIVRRATSMLDAEATFIAECLDEHGFWQVNPEEVGALTNAPLITNGRDVYGFMAYQVQSLLEELVLGKQVFWTKG